MTRQQLQMARSGGIQDYVLKVELVGVTTELTGGLGEESQGGAKGLGLSN